MSTEKYIPLHILEKITNGFSAHSRIGTGGYGDVYKAVYNETEVAVKLLHVDTVQGIDDQQYINEVGNLLSVNHPNIIQLLGYSYETRFELVVHNGERRLRQRIYRVLCFEYLQGESLDKHLPEESFAPDWSVRYVIIKGICEGLDFLHRCKPPIFHLDLKPANILLDSSMMPKVADFGLSRVISQSHTQVTKQIKGTQAYMPPEFIKDGYISRKNDVFSFGLVMIEIMTGSLGYSGYIETDKVVQFMQKVLSNWKNRIKATSEYPFEESHQVQTCIDTAMRCMEPDRNNRPTIAEVLNILNKTETHIPKRQMADALPFPTIGLKSESNMLEMMVAELNNNEHGHCNSMTTDSSNRIVEQLPDRETSSDVEEVIIGRIEEKEKILSILFESITEKMVMLPIYGIGGIGKTTLAQLVFNDPQFEDYTRVWVYVSQEFNLNKIGNSIITELTGKISNISTKQMLHKRLKELFVGKSILIVLDDLWEENPKEFDKLKVMLGLGLASKVIIVTTRDGGVAMKFCSPAVTPCKMETLTVDECWTIIKQKADFENRVDQEQLEHVGREIATKCGGVPLAAQSLGYMLNGTRSDEWESVRDSHIWNLSTSEGHEVLASLLLSYRHMSAWLKLCFSYCAIFPKGHKIPKYDLIHQWIALGFIKQSKTFDSMQICENYVIQLLGMAFFQYSKTLSSDTKQNKDVTLFTMHDLVHDLAKEILSHQISVGGNKCRYALLADCTGSLESYVAFPANIRALHFRDCDKQELHGGAFSSAKFLRVLDLSECYISKLPDCIGQLKQLRFLHAPRIQDKMIPNCITQLSELNYLNLRSSHNISALPKSIGDMKCLMHLDLSGCSEIHELPVSFAELRQLVHLDLSHCHISILQAFSGFTELQYLNLKLSGELPIDVKHIKGLPKVIGKLIKLRYLNLSGCLKVMEPLDDPTGSLLDSISTLSNLEHLDLSENEELSSIPQSITNLKKLHTLDLSGCFLLKKLPNNMVSLKVLNVEKCFILDKSVLSLLNCASLPHFKVHSSIDKSSSNIIHLQPTNPFKLIIDRLENVKSTEEARSVKLIEKKKIKELTFQWTIATERFVDDKEVLEKLVPPSSVQNLSIKGYMSVSFPDWLMGIQRYLPNLTQIDLWNFPNCNNLPPLGQIPNLRAMSLWCMEILEEWNMAYTSGEEGANELMFPKLEELRIEQCAKLRIKPCLPRATSLDIVDCDNVLSSWGESSSDSGASSCSPIINLNISESKVPFHQWRLLQHLPTLRSLTITGCSDLTTSPQIIQHLSSLESLSMRRSNCGSMKALPQWLGELTSLKYLEIEDCEGIRSLPDSIQQLAQLECLTIRGCPTLEKWCESEENEMKLARIKEVIPNAHQKVIEKNFLDLINNLQVSTGSRIDNKHKEAMEIDETIDLTYTKDVVENLGAVVHGTLTDEVHLDALYSAVMNMPGFDAEALYLALSHLMNNNALGSAYMEMQEEQRASWLMNFLKRTTTACSGPPRATCGETLAAAPGRPPIIPEAASMGSTASASSHPVLSLCHNATASTSECEEEDNATCGERPLEQTDDPEKRNSSRTEEGGRFSFRFLLDAFLTVVACFCSPQTRH